MNLLAGVLAVIIIVVPPPPSPPPSAPAPVPSAPTPIAPTPIAPTPIAPTPPVAYPAPVPAAPPPSAPAAAGTAADVARPHTSVTPVPLAAGTGSVVRVTDPVTLDAALAKATPGQTIELADGTYNGRFTLRRPGRADAPITLRGSRNAIINGGDTTAGDTLSLIGADYWQLTGFTVRGGHRGIVATRTGNTVLSALDIGNTGGEGVRLGSLSSDDVLQNSVVHDTGQATPGDGHGLVVGTARGTATGAVAAATVPDGSNATKVIDNTFRHTAAENVELHEDTSGGLIAGNSFDGSGIGGGADSVLDVGGTGYRVMDNITSGASQYLVTGFRAQVRTDPNTSGCGNTFLNNVFAVTLREDITLDPRCAAAGAWLPGSAATG